MPDPNISPPSASTGWTESGGMDGVEEWSAGRAVRGEASVALSHPHKQRGIVASQSRRLKSMRCAPGRT